MYHSGTNPNKNQLLRTGTRPVLLFSSQRYSEDELYYMRRVLRAINDWEYVVRVRVSAWKGARNFTVTPTGTEVNLTAYRNKPRVSNCCIDSGRSPAELPACVRAYDFGLCDLPFVWSHKAAQRPAHAAVLPCTPCQQIREDSGSEWSKRVSREPEIPPIYLL